MEAISAKVMAATLVPGHLVLFTTGDRIPADIRVTKAVDLAIDASNLTGENEPVRITAEARSRNAFVPAALGTQNLRPPTPSLALASSQDRSLKDKECPREGQNVVYMGTLV